jgi:hypothetical protein
MALLSIGWAESAGAAIVCPGAISANYTLSENIETTSPTGTCITINAGVTLNLAGHSILCRNASGCGTAVKANWPGTSGPTVKNGFITGTGSWSIAIDNGSVYPWANKLTVNDITVDGAAIGVRNPNSVQNSVLKNISDACISNSSAAMPRTGSVIQQTYCESTAAGFVLTGMSYFAWTPYLDVKRNYIHAGASSAGISATDFMTVEQNVVATGDPLITADPEAEVTENLCDDGGAYCDTPDSGFTFSLGFDPTP